MAQIFPNSMAKIRDDVAGDGVDVIVRTKDRPVLLKRALESVTAQEHANWHIHLVNDGGSPAVVDALVESFADRLAGRITVIHHTESRGTSAAGNAGFRSGEAAFVAVHDDDDSWHPAFLKSATAFLLHGQNRRFGGFLSRWNEVEEIIEGEAVRRLGTKEKGYDSEVLDFLDILRKPEIPPIAIIFRRSICERTGFFNADLPVLEDWDLDLRVLQMADIATSQDALANHHLRRRAMAAYNNTVTQSLDVHFRYNILYRNSMLRAYLDRNPDGLGLLLGVLRNAEMGRKNLSDLAIASHQALATGQSDFEKRLEKVEQDVSDIKAMMARMLTLLETR